MSDQKQTRKSSQVARIEKITPAGPDHQVVSVIAKGAYRKKPCPNCPWRVDATGEFPPEAFVVSARTAYDMSDRVFSCHTSGAKRPAICAGFLLKGADHNLAVRLKYIRGEIHNDVSDAGHQLHENYRAMAVANGVDPLHPTLSACRD